MLEAIKARLAELAHRFFVAMSAATPYDPLDPWVPYNYGPAWGYGGDDEAETTTEDTTNG